MTTHRGACHCGAVSFEVDGVIERVTVCNCSICARAGYVHWYVDAAHFRLLCAPDAYATYRFGTGRARHHFCHTCGISPFRRPRSDPHLFDVNVRCLDGVDPEAFPVDRFDGCRWEEAEAEGQLDSLRDPLRRG